MTVEQIRKKIAKEGRHAVDWGETPYVPCDEPCFALAKPVTLEECKAALAHWKNHSYLSGCSHGC